MANKRAKSGSGSAAPVGSKDWEAGLSAALFDEESWRVSVSLVVGDSEMCLSALEQAVQKQLRRLFSLLSWENTLEKINELGNPKAKKTKDVPVFYEVMELAKSVLDAGQKLSVDLTAKLLKFQLLAIKSSDLQRRDALQRVAEEKVKVKVGTGHTGTPAKGSTKGEKAKKSEALPLSKETKLKRRGEEDDSHKYIDDEPDDGPHHYILITGFHQPCLISALDLLGVHVSNVIRLSSDRPEMSDPSLDLPAETSLSAAEQQSGVAVRQGEKPQLEEFWDQLARVLNSGGVGSRLWDVARLDYKVERSLLSPDPGCPEAMQTLGVALFEGVACLLYDSLDWRRQHQHYLSSMWLIPVPVASGAQHSSSAKGPTQAPQTQAPQTAKKKPVAKEILEVQHAAEPEPASLSTEVDMRLYQDQLDRLPAQGISVPLILHYMLEQVVASEQEESADLEKHADWSEEELTSYMLSCALSHPHLEQERKRLMEDFGMREDDNKKIEQRETILLFHHDQRARRLHQLPVPDRLDVNSIERATMERNVVWNQLMSTHQHSTHTAMARRHELLYLCSDDSLSSSTVQRLLQLCVFESMPLSTTDPSGDLTPPPSATLTPSPWDDPITYAQHLYRSLKRTQGSSEACEDQTVEGVSAADLQSTLTWCWEGWNFTEHHSRDIFPQVLQTACEAYRCTDMFYSSVNNATFLICHNPMSPERCSRESWEGAVHTDVGFRDYLEYVAPALTEWISQEEQKRQSHQQRELETPIPPSSTQRHHPNTPSSAQRHHPNPPSSAQRHHPNPPSSTQRHHPNAPSSAQRHHPSPPSSAQRHRTAETAVVCPGAEDTVPHIRQGSLKAWKLEQQQLKEEGLSKHTKKEGKGKSSAKGGDKDEANSARESREDQSHIKRESKTPDCAKKPEGDVEIPQENTPVLIGYSMNGRLVQVKGETQDLYPPSGGHISVDRVHFVQASTQLKVCVNKDGHSFYTHVSHQQRQDSRNADNKGGTEQGGCFYGVLHSGIQLSYSCTPLQRTKETGTMETGATETGATEMCFSPLSHTQQVGEGECGNSAPLRLHVSLPTGLRLSFGFEETEGGQAVLVRQIAPPVGHGPPLLSTFTELSRTITSLGTVIKHMRDGSTEVLFADGTVSSSPDSGPVCVLVPSSAPQQERDTPTDSKDRKGKVNSRCTVETDLMETLEEEHRLPLEVTGGSWTTTTPSGFRVASSGGRRLEVSPLLTFSATDPFTQSVMITREDRVLSVVEKDGTTIVDHADGTRITTYYQQRELPQHQSSAGGSTEGGREKLVKVESGVFTTVTVSSQSRNCDVLFGDGTVITASPHGTYRVCPSGGGVLHICEDGVSLYSSNPCELGPEEQQSGQYIMSHCAGALCRFTDPDGSLYQVSADGYVSIRSSRGPTQSTHTDGEIHSVSDTYPPRLFVMDQDCSGTEVLSTQVVEELLKEAYSDPTVAVVSEPLPDQPDVFGITVLTPLPGEVSTRWLLPTQQDDIIPANLKSRKWDTFPASELKCLGAQTPAVRGAGLERDRTRSGLQNPAALLARQMIQHPPATLQLCIKLQDKLLMYINQLVQKEKLKDEMQVKEPRTAQERSQQSQLLQLVLSLPDSEHHPVTVETRPLCDVATLYSQAVSSACPTSNLQEQEALE